MAVRLLTISKLRDTLRDREKGIGLIKELSRKTAEGNGRENYSFATKFCHYACLYFFKEKDTARDNYSIYDDVLASVLPYYAEVYLNEHYTKVKFKNYKLYSDVIDRIRAKAAEINKEPMVSRNGFDHLLWYYHKGNPIGNK